MTDLFLEGTSNRHPGLPLGHTHYYQSHLLVLQRQAIALPLRRQRLPVGRDPSSLLLDWPSTLLDTLEACCLEVAL